MKKTILSAFSIIFCLLLITAQVYAGPIIVWPLKTIFVKIKNSDQIIVLSPSILSKDEFNIYIFEKSKSHIKAYGIMKSTANGYVGFIKNDNGQIFKTYLLGNDILFFDVSILEDDDKKIVENIFNLREGDLRSASLDLFSTAL